MTGLLGALFLTADFFTAAFLEAGLATVFGTDFLTAFAGAFTTRFATFFAGAFLATPFLAMLFLVAEFFLAGALFFFGTG